ncbi:MAG: SAM-dependent chlorinase/fluorinase [Bacteroidales bacterium]|nr:SAM-dependent chlorinase/fluorinase [Bacteroidales bacterium]
MIVTLITDWHRSDYYLGCLKGSLLAAFPNVQIVDVNHNISAFNSAEAAFILQRVYPCFPAGTLHFIGVNSEPEPTQSLVLLKAADHYFVGPDDGCFSLIFQHTPVDACLVLPLEPEPSTFSAIPSLLKAIQIIISGYAELVGNAHQLQKSWLSLPGYDNNSINGQVVYIDSYGNIHSNIDKELFDRICCKRQYEIILSTPFVKIHAISEHYNEVRSNELLCLFNSAGYLEFARNNDNLARSEGIGLGAPVRIKFLNKYT